MTIERNILPPCWATATIGQLIGDAGIFIDGDWVESKDQDPNGSVRLIQLADIGDGDFRDKSRRFLTPEKAHELNCTFLEHGDILIARMPEPLGRCCIFPLDRKEAFVTVVDVCVVRIGSAPIDNKFLMYAINSGQVRTKIADLQSGSTRKRISRGNLATIEIPLAPYKEQRRIVAKIEELFSELDKGVESLTTAREQLTTYRQAVLKHAFEGKLFAHQSRDRQHWPECRVGDAIDFLTSGSRGWADYYATEGEIFIRAQNLKHDRLDLTNVAFVKLPSGNSEGIRTRVHVGDVLITITGANVTKTGLVEGDIGTADVSQHVALCRPNRLIVPEFLYWFLISEAGGRRQLNEAAYGAGKPGLNLDNIRQVKIPLPSLAVQRKVIALIRSSISIEENLRAAIEEEMTRTLALRQSILKNALSGQLVMQDPDEEPASVLLQRIKAERENGGGDRKKNNKNGKKEAA